MGGQLGSQFAWRMSTSNEGHYWLQVDQLVAMVVDARNTCGPMKRHVLHVSNASMIELAWLHVGQRVAEHGPVGVINQMRCNAR